MFKAVVGTTSNQQQAEQIVGDLKAAGFPAGEISVLFPRPDDSAGFAAEMATKVPEGAAIGAASVGSAGMWLGGGIGLLAGLGAIAIPGLGVFLAVGPLLSLLSGAAVGASVGATVGTLTGVLITLGIPELEAKHYEGRLSSGRILISVHSEERQRQLVAAAVLRARGAEDICSAEETLEPMRAPISGAAQPRPSQPGP